MAKRTVERERCRAIEEFPSPNSPNRASQKASYQEMDSQKSLASSEVVFDDPKLLPIEDCQPGKSPALIVFSFDCEAHGVAVFGHRTAEL